LESLADLQQAPHLAHTPLHRLLEAENEAPLDHPGLDDSDVGPRPMTDLDEPEGLQGLDRLPQCVAGDAQLLPELGLGGQYVAGVEPSLQDVVLDRLHHLALPRSEGVPERHRGRALLTHSASSGPCSWRICSILRRSSSPSLIDGG